MITGIYFIKNIINDRLYIGSSNNIHNRWYDHLRELRANKHYNKFLQRSFNKYGENNFVFGVLEICNQLYLFEREQFYLDTYKNLYNIEKVAGKPPSQLGKVVSDKTRAKIADIWRGRKHTEQTKKMLSNQKKGKTLSENHRKNLSTAFLNSSKVGRTYSGILVSPSGEQYINIHNRAKFCREHNLNDSCLKRVIKGIRNHHKGWKFIPL